MKKKRRTTDVKWLCLLALLWLCYLPLIAQTHKSVTIQLKNASIREVFAEIKRQTDVGFMYSNSAISALPRKDYNFVNAPISKILSHSLAGSNLTFEIESDQHIIIKRKKVEKDITGKVVDSNGDPLAGVSVYERGTKNGTTTDTEGNFQLASNGKNNLKLIVSFIGMRQQEVTWKGNSLNILLEDDSQNIGEVVITGYQEIDRRKLASSILSIKGSELIGGEHMSVDKMLQGRLPGVAVMNMSSTPGAAPKIRIRGSSSITGNREPVWVVDGIILEEPVNISTEELNSPDKINLIGNAIGSLNPEDIERVDILKDASATAIYGVKAANGVIVVTTKRGKNQKPSISYTATLGITAPPTYDKMFRMNSADRIDMSIEMQERGLSFGSYKPSDIGYEGALQHLWNKDINYNEFLSQVKTLKQLNTNWYDLLFRTAFTHQHSVSITGGNERSDYYMSVGYADNQSVTIHEGLERYNVLARINTKINRNLQLGLKVSGALSKAKHPHSSIDPYEYAYNTSRAIPMQTPSGDLHFYAHEAGYNGTLMYNIKNELNHSGNSIDNSSIDVTANLDWKVASWMRFSSILGLNRSYVSQETWADE
ncbi:SusC/RagA family TonB-linked outer membrane protein, partial [Bacteroides congonensis]|uniref:SusC/RagA family TonB-linked outer membrane protein n=1 Tax=Bacteroides congonensis TaxID=1871006 RepID=UPI0025A3D647